MSARCTVLVLLVMAAVHAVVAENFYEVLGVTEEADAKQIKRAYRKLSLKYHPDKNAGNPEAEAKFQAIARAYEVLSDDEKRQVYDLEGEEGLENLEKGDNRPASPFDMFFGGGGGRRRGPNAQVSTQVSLEDLYNGGERSARIKRNVICRKCKGTGAKDGATKKCSACGGKGVRLVQQQMAPGFNVQMQQTCEKCGGKGVVFKTKCPYCKGKKVVPEEKELTATIERGMPSDYEIVFERQSEQAPGITPGDVVFKLHQAPHPRFKREGDDLHHTMHISLREALLGFKKPIRHLDGRDVEVATKGITKPFEVRTVEDEGMPVHNFPSQKGNLHVKYHVDFPKKLTDKQKALVEELFSE